MAEKNNGLNKDELNALLEYAKKAKTLQDVDAILFELLEKKATLMEIEKVLDKVLLEKEAEEDRYERE